MENDIELFKGTSFSDLLKEIAENSRDKKQQIDVLISDLRTFIKGPNDAMTMVPLIRDYIDVGVKNDEQLVKMAAIAQRIVSGGKSGGQEDISGFKLSDEERKKLEQEAEQLFKNSQDVTDSMKKLEENK